MNDYDTYIALNRLGLGARPGDAKHVGRDPRAWLKSQIEPQAGVAPAGPGGAEVATSEDFRTFITRRLGQIVATERPFYERWIGFWSNHFTVSTTNGAVGNYASAYEREAIMTHAFGSFAELLRAVVRHPAMLHYLDNVRSIGPHSVAGMSSLNGLNENLAREILELHTLGVDGGYGQPDVYQFAKVLTGWTVNKSGQYQFIIERHEPRDKILLGKTIAWGRDDEGETALRLLADHPSTARFVAWKLARHFVADDPPASAVERLTAVFAETGGDLTAMAHAVIDLPEVWQEAQVKVRRADEFVIAALRATGIEFEPIEPYNWMKSLGQKPYGASAPEGWSDEAEDWLAPSSIDERIKLCFLIASRVDRAGDPRVLAKAVLGPYLSQTSARAIAVAESREQAVALMLASPEFQQR